MIRATYLVTNRPRGPYHTASRIEAPAHPGRPGSVSSSSKRAYIPEKTSGRHSHRVGDAPNTAALASAWTLQILNPTGLTRENPFLGERGLSGIQSWLVMLMATRSPFLFYVIFSPSPPHVALSPGDTDGLS